MKSIKEKTEEHATCTREDSWDKTQKCIIAQISFEEGANFALSVLYDAAYKEDWITNPKDGIRRFFEIYRQLKK